MRAVKPPSLATHLESEGEPALALILDWRLGLNWVVNLQQRLAICAFELDAGTIARPHQTLELKSHTGHCGLALQAHQLGRQPAVRSRCGLFLELLEERVQVQSDQSLSSIPQLDELSIIRSKQFVAVGSNRNHTRTRSSPGLVEIKPPKMVVPSDRTNLIPNRQ